MALKCPRISSTSGPWDNFMTLQAYCFKIVLSVFPFLVSREIFKIPFHTNTVSTGEYISYSLVPSKAPATGQVLLARSG